MFDDEMHDSDRPAKEPVERDHGVLLGGSDGTRRIGIREGEGGTTQDDVAEDAYVGDERPGTVDDVPYSLGTEEYAPADTEVGRTGATREGGGTAPAEELETDIGRRDERELWARQRQLREEDAEDGIKLAGFSDEQARRVVDAMGDEAHEVLPGSPNGTSATGSTTEAEHGGFPERE